MKKVVVAGMLGNGLEWYDFALYGQMAVVIGHLFFPTIDDTAKLLASFGVFAVGFIFRPLGAILFGYIGDRYGRRLSLVIAILMMAIPTGCIGLLPTYEQIGILAPILLTIIRIFQGLSLGGEFSGSIAYIVEHAPPHRRGIAGAASIASLILGFMLGTVVAMFTVQAMPTEDFESWGWRVPFLFGIVIGMVGLYIRKSCSESPEYEAAKEAGHISQRPVRDAITGHWRKMLQAFGAYMAVTMPFYLTSIYLISYTKTHLHRGHDEALTINFCVMFAMLAGTGISAVLSDRWSCKKVMMPAAVAMLLAAVPAFGLMRSGQFSDILMAQTLLGLLVGFYIGPVATLLVEIFPTSVRYTGMAIAYNLCAALLGGTAPMVCEWLISATGSTQAVAYYVMFCCTCSLLALASYREQPRS